MRILIIRDCWWNSIPLRLFFTPTGALCTFLRIKTPPNRQSYGHIAKIMSIITEPKPNRPSKSPLELVTSINRNKVPSMVQRMNFQVTLVVVLVSDHEVIGSERLDLQPKSSSLTEVHSKIKYRKTELISNKTPLSADMPRAPIKSLSRNRRLSSETDSFVEGGVCSEAIENTGVWYPSDRS